MIRRRYLEGLTLVEIIVSIFLLGVMMTIFARMATHYAVILRHQDQKDRALANLKMAVDTVSSEIEEAIAVSSPATDGESRGEVVFERYDPETFNEKLAARIRITVHYFLEAGTLYREITPPSSPKVTYPVAHDLAGISVKRENSALYRINVSIQEAGVSYSVEGKAFTRSCK